MKKTVYGFVVLLIGITLLSCGKPNPLSPPVAEVQQAINFTDEKLPTSSGEFVYRQTIYLSEQQGYEYSYRLSTIDNILPTGMTADAEGWLYFPNPIYTSEELLLEPVDHHIVWTNKSRINLDFYSTDGKLSNLITKVEVRTKAPNGTISCYDSPFKSDRLMSSRIVVPFFSGAVTGTGVEFKLQENTSNIYVEGMLAHHFMYRLNTLDSNQTVLNYGTWYNTIDCPDIRTVLLNGSTTPALTANPSGFTQFESYVVSRLGVEEASHQSVLFVPTAGNKPQAIIYPETIVGLGQYHNSNGNNSSYPDFNSLIPYSSLYGFNRLLWSSSIANDYYAINSYDFKLHLRWGYRGQYVNNNPFLNRVNACLNEQGNAYYSKIIAYDLRLNGAPFPVKPGFFEPHNVTYTDGTTWLRVYNMFDSCQHTILDNLSNGVHTFEVCAVDNQNVPSNPQSISITLNPYKPVSQRSGILIVDDSVHHSSNSPEQIVDAFYSSVVPSNWGAVNSIDLAELNTYSLPQGAVMLQNYKAVIWHSDNHSTSGNLYQNLEALSFYLGYGGNLLISGTRQLTQTFQHIISTNPAFANDYLGINPNLFGVLSSLSSSFTTNPFFVQATGLNGLQSINLNTTSSFNSIVNARKGLGVITYFNPGSGLDFIYQFGCKPVNSETYPPTQAQYDMYSSKYVAYKHSHLGSNVVVFGFPLSYMEQADVSSALQGILTNILGSKVAEGRNK